LRSGLYGGPGSRIPAPPGIHAFPGWTCPAATGELAFDAPWQGTVFALAAAVIEHVFGGDREPFRQQLVKAIAAKPGRSYWESWTVALEALVPTLTERSAL
jgi:hypothetical protein